MQFIFTFQIRKRKAEASPLKNDRVKRYALTNLTNNLNNEIEDTSKKVVLKEIQPVSYRTRAAAAAATTTNAIELIAPIKPIAKALKKQPKITNENFDKPSKNKAIGTTVLKSKSTGEISGKQSISTRRISNEFERTEDSLYVSALEEIPSDISRLSDKTKSSIDTTASQISVVSSSSSLGSQNEADDTEWVDRKLPSGVQHFDRENWKDHLQVSHYAMDIFEYLRNQESKYQIKDYMSEQPELSKWMRSLLVDWMVEVQESFELNHETLYLAIKIVDTYLGKELVSKDSLQLLGAAALLIACKYDVS